YLSLSALYLLTHGLGVDDLRFYRDPATGVFQPIPRDLNPGTWGTAKPYRTFLTHFSWWIDLPPHTIWPVKKLRDYDYSFEKSKTDFSDDNTTTGVADSHYAIPPFLASPENMETVNRYLSFYSKNFAIKRKIEERLLNAFKMVLKFDPINNYLRTQQTHIKRNGVFFLGDLFAYHTQSDALTFSDGKESYLWNIRTAEKLDKKLRPSLFSPMSYRVSKREFKNQFVLNFLVEKKIFESIEEAGISIEPKSYRKLKEPVDDSTAMPLRVIKHRGLRKSSGWGVESVFSNVVEHLATLPVESDKALVLFLVRNATEEVTDYKLKMRDSLAGIDPMINKTFFIDEDPRWNRASTLQIMNNQFLRGERLRLLAFEVPLSKKTDFYTLKIPSGSRRFFLPWMYLPPKSTPKTMEAKAATKLADGIKERDGDYHITANTELGIDSDLVIPGGKALYIGEGVTLKISKGSSIKVTGSLYVSGSGERPVRFVSSGVEPWGGLYVAGSSTTRAKVIIKNAVLDNYGTFPKTRVDGLYLNGGVTFYKADVTVEGVKFTNAKSEDAVNFISSTLKIDGMEVSGAFSDGVDLDFSNGLIERLRIIDSGGDSLDLSASLVKIVDSVFERSKDKGLSVGEMSRVYVLNTRFIGNSMGIANKDQSRVDVRESFFIGNETALAEFIKKPAYGRPVAVMKDNTYKDNKKKYEWLGFYFY
ncbi:MAG: right-handed parallel beta-helix repeat-containing protein, partial [Thermodesulfobacteriota bacterium]